MPTSIRSVCDRAGLRSDPALAAIPWQGAAISTRELEPGAAFIALAGRHTHGIEHVEAARAAGASAVLVGADADIDLVHAAGRVLPLARHAGGSWELMAALGRAWRRTALTTVVGITGSTGKTSARDILAAQLRPHGSVVASRGNDNNEIGVPLTLLNAPAGTDVVICEMGMRGLGQIDYLCRIAEPTVGIVLNAGPVHLELLGSVERIVQAKAEIIAGTDPDGIAISPIAQPELDAAAQRHPAEHWHFAGGATVGAGVAVPRPGSLVAARVDGADLTGELHTADPDGSEVEESFRLPGAGLHHATNVAAAAAASRAIERRWLGTQSWQLASGLGSATLTEGRGNRVGLPAGGLVLDGSYNANPMSMRAALDELAAIDASGRRIAVLGAMAELGPDAPRFHAEVGDHAARIGVDVLVAVGASPEVSAMVEAFRDACGRDVLEVADPEALIEAAPGWLQPGDLVLVKASNGVGLGGVAGQLVQLEAVR